MPSGEWRNFSICVASVLPPGPPDPVAVHSARTRRSHSTAGLRRGVASSSSSRFSMKSSDATSTGGMSSKRAYARDGWVAENSGVPVRPVMCRPAWGFSR